MASGVTPALLLLLCGPVLLPQAGDPERDRDRDPDRDRGLMELRRVRSLAAQPRYGDCWARALDHLDARCREMTSETQGRLALTFTRCHLSSSGRAFPSCPEGSEVRSCTAQMDSVAFNAYTEFFTHAHAICHFLQSEAWQSRAETTMSRLTETSAGVAEQLQSTRQMAEDLMEAQTTALQAQQEILENGEQLRVTLRDSTQGLQSVFSELSGVTRQQQVALSELFNRVSFLQTFLLTEAHSVSSCLYNGAALCSAFLLTSTQRSSRARLFLLVLVCVNFYLERKIYQYVTSSAHPEHTHMELVSVYVSVLRRCMLCVAVCVLVFVCVSYRDPVQQSFRLLQQLRETQCSLQEALQRAEHLGRQKEEVHQTRGKEVPWRSEGLLEEEEEEEEVEEKEGSALLCLDSTLLPAAGWSSDSLLSSTLAIAEAEVWTPPASASPVPVVSEHPRRRGSLVHSIPVEHEQVTQRRYSLRSRKSEIF